jgi:2-amino-4-hydroxy-6-hydroxymethyldihydropteridine diphosphokinase
MIVPVGIALGSNLGDRAAELDDAVAFLQLIAEDHQVRESPRIETVPVDCTPGSQDFLNSVAEINLDSIMLTPLILLGCLQEFEIERGRSPIRETNSPRPIDLDIIYYGDQHFDDMGLVIPHPRAHQRRFVLDPLSQLRPDLILPGQTKTVTELLAELRNNGIFGRDRLD